MALNTGHSLYANIVQAHKADDALPKLVDQIGSSDIAGQTYHWHKDDIVQASITPQQGIARNATHWFSSSSSVIKKYDLTGTEVASNSSPFTGLSGSPNHIGDGYVDGSYYYLPICYWDGSSASDIQIVRYNISDLSLAGYWDVSGSGFTGSGISLNIAGTEIVGTNYDTTTGSNTLYRFNKTTGAYIGSHTLTDTIKGIQGISTDGTDYYISSYDTTAGRNIIYRVDSSFNTINKITPVTVSNTTTYEGEGVECYDGKLYFHTINAAIRELTPLTLYIDNGLGSPQQFMSTPADTGTILMRVTPRTFYNYNSIIDNTVTANDWEAWIYATGQLSWRVDATFKCDYTLPSADQEYVVAFTWAKSGSNVTIKLGVDGTYRSTQTGVWQTAPGALWLAGKNASNNQGNNIYRDIFVFDKVLSDAELSDTYTNFDNLYATPGGTTYDVYASFAFTNGLSQSGSAQAQAGITLASAVSCDDTATGDYNANATLANALTVSNSGLSQAQATAALAASLGYSVDGIIAFFVDVSFATSHSGTFSGTATGQGAINLNTSLDQTVSSIAQTIASVVFNSSHGLQNTTGQSIDGAISLGVSAGFQTLGVFTISGNITLNASLAAQLNASAQANANLNLGAQIGLSVLAQAAAQAGITLSQVVSVVHTGTSTVFGITTPDGRVYTVEIDTRTLTIEAENRTYTVN